MKDQNGPVFIIGTERSGTNLLRLILNAHSHIAIPHPPHILKNFFALEPLYGDLGKDKNFKNLIRDVVRSVEIHPYPWETAVDKERLFLETHDRSLLQVYFAIYDQHREHARKKRWGCKSTFMIHHVALVRQERPAAQFVYMVRDGRDVAASAKESIFNHYSVYHTAGRWRQEQRTGIYWLSKLSEDEIFLLKYEDLVQQPERTMRALVAFLGEPYEETMLRFFETGEAKKSGSLSEAWRHTAQAILHDRVGRFNAALKKEEIDIIETMAGEELDYFSYPLARPFFVSEGRRARGISLAARLCYGLEEKWLAFFVQARALFKDKNTFLRYRKYWFLKFVWLKRFVLHFMAIVPARRVP